MNDNGNNRLKKELLIGKFKVLKPIFFAKCNEISFYCETKFWKMNNFGLLAEG